MSSPTIPWQQILGLPGNPAAQAANTQNAQPSGIAATPGLTTGLPIQSAINPNAQRPDQASVNTAQALQAAQALSPPRSKAAAAQQQAVQAALQASAPQNVNTDANPSTPIPQLNQGNAGMGYARGGRVEKRQDGGGPVGGGTGITGGVGQIPDLRFQNTPAAPLPPQFANAQPPAPTPLPSEGDLARLGMPSIDPRTGGISARARGGIVERKQTGGVTMTNPFGFGNTPAPTTNAPAPAPAAAPAANPQPMGNTRAPQFGMLGGPNVPSSGGQGQSPLGMAGNAGGTAPPPLPAWMNSGNGALVNTSAGNPLIGTRPGGPSGGLSATGSSAQTNTTGNQAMPRWQGPAVPMRPVNPAQTGATTSQGGQQNNQMIRQPMPRQTQGPMPNWNMGSSGNAIPLAAQGVNQTGTAGASQGQNTTSAAGMTPSQIQSLRARLQGGGANNLGTSTSGMACGGMVEKHQDGGTISPALQNAMLQQQMSGSGAPAGGLTPQQQQQLQLAGQPTGGPVLVGPPQQIVPGYPQGVPLGPPMPVPPGLQGRAGGGMVGLKGLGSGFKAHPIAKIKIQAIHPIRMTNPLGGSASFAEGGTMGDAERTDHIDPGTSEYETYARGGAVENMADGARHLRGIHHLFPKSVQPHIQKAHRQALDEIHNAAFSAAEPTDATPAAGPGTGPAASPSDSPMAATAEPGGGTPDFKRGGAVKKHKAGGGAISGKAGEEADSKAEPASEDGDKVSAAPKKKEGYARGGYVDSGTAEFACASGGGSKSARGMGVAKRGGDFTYKRGGQVKK